MVWSQVEDATRALANVTIGSFVGVPNQSRTVDLHYRLYDAHDEHHGCVVVVAGMTEAATTYQEVIYDLVRNGFSAYIYDHRGHGFSSRLLPGKRDTDKGHVDKFDNMVLDLERFVSLVRGWRTSQPDPRTNSLRPAPGRIHILANSMGGTVASQYLSRGTLHVTSAAMVAPMHKMKVGYVATFLLSCRVLWLLLPFASTYLINGHDFATAHHAFISVQNGALSDNEMSHSKTRLRRRWLARAAEWTDACGERRDARVSGQTLRWVLEAHSASVQSCSERAVANVRCRTLLLQAENDNVVHFGGQLSYYNNANASVGCAKCTAFKVANARHLILNETDACRNPALATILSFFAQLEGGE